VSVKDPMKRVLAAKAVQREKSRNKSFGEKLATIERMRERRILLARKRSTAAKP